MKRLVWASLILGLCAACSATRTAPTTSRTSPAAQPPSAPQAAGTLRIDGDVARRDLSVSDLEALGASDVTWSHRDQKHVFRAVDLDALVRSVGLEPGAMGGNVAPAEKRAGWKYVLVATASDGFQAVFSFAEIAHDMGATRAYVALAQDGAPIGDADGPLRIVVPSDGEASRSVRNLRRLTILDMRRVVRAGP